jgi:hypothetical protein
MHILGGGQRDESGRGKEEEAMMTAAAMLSRESRRWGYRDGNDGEEEDGEGDGSDWTDGGGDGEIDEAISNSLCDIENKSCFGGTCAHHPQIREK